jgi:hypothetical protein
LSEGVDGAEALTPLVTGRAGGRKSAPLYPRLLRLRHVHPNAWQRAALGEGALAVAVLLVLADLATAWTLLVLPLAVAAVVKAHDLLAGLLASGPTEQPQSAHPPQQPQPAHQPKPERAEPPDRA